MGSPTRPASNMKHNNQIHSTRKFRKYWQRYVKTWFDQPSRKKNRRIARDKKAADVAPRPVAGCVRPVVHPPTVKYNTKTRIGRGFSLAELKALKLGKLEARSLGIAVDPRRRNLPWRASKPTNNAFVSTRPSLSSSPAMPRRPRRDGPTTPLLLRWKSLTRPKVTRSCQLLSRLLCRRHARSPLRRKRPMSLVTSRLHGTMLAFVATARSVRRRRPRRQPRKRLRRLSKMALHCVVDFVGTNKMELVKKI